MKAVYLEVLPQLAVNLVFLLEERLEIHEDGDWLAWDVPASDLHQETFRQGFLLPIGKQLGIFREIRTRVLAPTIRAYEDEIVAKLVVQRLCTC